MEHYRATMKAIIQKIGYDYDIDIVELEIPEDHIHMVVRSVPKQSPSNVMQVIKSITAREFFRIYPEIKKKYFWGESYGLKVILSKRLVMRMKNIRKYVQEQLAELDQKEMHSDQLDLL